TAAKDAEAARVRLTNEIKAARHSIPALPPTWTQGEAQTHMVAPLVHQRNERLVLRGLLDHRHTQRNQPNTCWPINYARALCAGGAARPPHGPAKREARDR